MKEYKSKKKQQEELIADLVKKVDSLFRGVNSLNMMIAELERKIEYPVKQSLSPYYDQWNPNYNQPWNNPVPMPNIGGGILNNFPSAAAQNKWECNDPTCPCRFNKRVTGGTVTTNGNNGGNALTQNGR